MIDPEEMKNAEKKYEEEKLKCKKRKKACIDIIDNFCECMEKSRNEIMVSI
jgi:tryptophanyl-tRNA synthetase